MHVYIKQVYTIIPGLTPLFFISSNTPIAFSTFCYFPNILISIEYVTLLGLILLTFMLENTLEASSNSLHLQHPSSKLL
jgi:hypothetical protein